MHCTHKCSQTEVAAIVKQPYRELWCCDHDPWCFCTQLALELLRLLLCCCSATKLEFKKSFKQILAVHGTTTTTIIAILAITTTPFKGTPRPYVLAPQCGRR